MMLILYLVVSNITLYLIVSMYLLPFFERQDIKKCRALPLLLFFGPVLSERVTAKTKNKANTHSYLRFHSWILYFP